MAGKLLDITTEPMRKDWQWPFTNAGKIEQTNTGLHVISAMMEAGSCMIAPAWLDPYGPDIETARVQSYLGPARVISVAGRNGTISYEELSQKQILPGERILLKTRNSDMISKGKQTQHWTVLSEEAAQLLADHQVACVGLDYGVTCVDQTHLPIFQLLLHKSIGLITNLNLTEALPGVYTMHALPWVYHGGVSPCRVVLEE